MKRKVIKQGYNTLTVTLPTDWTKKFNIKPGDEVDIIEQGRGLQVSTEKGPNLSTITIDISRLSPAVIWRYLLAAYRAGYDEITITGIDHNGKKKSAFSSKTSIDFMNNKKFSMTSPTEVIQLATSSVLRTSFDWNKLMTPIEVISACVNRLIGMEIIEQKDDYCKIKELGETTYKEFNNAFRRMFTLIKLEMEYVENALNDKKLDMKEMFIIDTNLDRFEDFCMRVLNKKGYSEYRKTSVMYCISFILEMIGDELKKVSHHIINDRAEYTKLIKDLFIVQTRQMDRIYDLFYKFDKEKIMEIYVEDKNGSDMIDKYFKRLNNGEKELLHHFKKIGIFVLSLTELRIDMEL
jgi:phosphate uptake regulator